MIKQNSQLPDSSGDSSGDSSDNSSGNNSGDGSGRQLESLLARRDIWRASSVVGGRNNVLQSYGVKEAVDTGYTQLNDKLLAKGWPQTGLIELCNDAPGYGEWQLLLPALSQMPCANTVLPPSTCNAAKFNDTYGRRINNSLCFLCAASVFSASGQFY